MHSLNMQQRISELLLVVLWSGANRPANKWLVFKSLLFLIIIPSFFWLPSFVYFLLIVPSSMSGNGFADGSAQAIYYCCPTPDPTNCQISQGIILSLLSYIITNINIIMKWLGCILPAQCRAGPVANTQYVKLVHKDTKGVYAYSYDDGVGYVLLLLTSSFYVSFIPRY